MEVNTCTNELVTQCICPTTEECITIIGCQGTQRCDFYGCGGCSCENEIATGSEAARRITPGLDGDLYILLNESPWIVHIDKQGNSTSLDTRGNLSWVDDFVVDGQGNIVLAGSTPVEADDVVQIQRLNPNGEVAAATQWQIPPYNSSWRDTRLVGLGVLSNGNVVASATLFFLVGHAFITNETTVGSDIVLDMTAVADEYIFNSRYGARQIIGPNDEILLSGVLGTGEQIWMAQFSSTGEYIAEFAATTSYYASSSAIATIANSGVVYGGWSSVISGFSPDASYIRRFGDGLKDDWTITLEDDANDTHLFDLHGLNDSVLVLLERGETSYLARVDAQGVFIDYTKGNSNESELLIPLSYTPIDSILRNNSELVILSETEGGYRISSMTFSVAGAGRAQSGEPCYSDTDCEKGGCCFEARGGLEDLLISLSGDKEGNGICADPKVCEVGYLCEGDHECLSGLCLIAAEETSGICSSECGASSDCDSDYYCAPIECSESECPNICLFDCLSGGTDFCKSKYDPWVCQDTENTEGITVPLCR